MCIKTGNSMVTLWITQPQDQPQNESYNKLIYIMSNKGLLPRLSYLQGYKPNPFLEQS